MKIRYSKQRDTHNCGAVAILNALKFQGVRKTYSDVKVIARKIGADQGTWKSKFDKNVHKYLTCTRKVKPKLKEVVDFLTISGNSVIIVYRLNGGFDGHYTFVHGVSKSKNVLYTTNDSWLHGVNRHRRLSTFEKRWNQNSAYGNSIYPWVWFISGSKLK